jgi:hypothetical protein
VTRGRRLGKEHGAEMAHAPCDLDSSSANLIIGTQNFIAPRECHLELSLGLTTNAILRFRRWPCGAH